MSLQRVKNVPASLLGETLEHQTWLSRAKAAPERVQSRPQAFSRNFSANVISYARGWRDATRTLTDISLGPAYFQGNAQRRPGPFGDFVRGGGLLGCGSRAVAGAVTGLAQVAGEIVGPIGTGIFSTKLRKERLTVGVEAGRRHGTTCGHAVGATLHCITQAVGRTAATILQLLALAPGALIGAIVGTCAGIAAARDFHPSHYDASLPPLWAPTLP